MFNSLTRPPISFGHVVLDTPQPAELAEFYAELLGWEVTRSEDDWFEIRGESTAAMGFQLAPDFIPTTWPDPDVPMQIHLDLDVPDLDEGQRWAESLGATYLDGPDENPGFRVFQDPTGHLFCLCLIR